MALEHGSENAALPQYISSQGLVEAPSLQKAVSQLLQQIYNYQ
jgi:hypothetical protein